jgi:hypothetical protein
MDARNLKFGSSVLQAGNVSGHVQDIGFMQTRVQGFDGVPVLVPNQAFTSQVLNCTFDCQQPLNSSFLKSPKLWICICLLFQRVWTVVKVI